MCTLDCVTHGAETLIEMFAFKKNTDKEILRGIYLDRTTNTLTRKP